MTKDDIDAFIYGLDFLVKHGESIRDEELVKRAKERKQEIIGHYHLKEKENDDVR